MEPLLSPDGCQVAVKVQTADVYTVYKDMLSTPSTRPIATDVQESY